ncbi:tRNA pseudouridine synthase A [Bifidobacterium avesanii]
MRLRIDLAYDGGGFYGWAKQPTLRTVQGEIEGALAKILRAPADGPQPRLVVAGRTDTGVHAAHQVCHLDVEESALDACVGYMDVPAETALQRRIDRMLPDDIVIHRVSRAPEGFDARFSALERTYVYRVCDADDPATAPMDPRLRGFVLRVDGGPLDVDAMNEALAATIGLHDFGSFATPNPGGTTIREVKYARWDRVPVRPLVPSAWNQNQNRERTTGEDRSDGIRLSAPGLVVPTSEPVGQHAEGSMDASGLTASVSAEPVGQPASRLVAGADVAPSPAYVTPTAESGLLALTIVADAFARNMVRSLVGASIKVGLGKRSVDWFRGKVAVPKREGETGPIAPQGLTLEHVAYPPDDQLAARAEAIRAKRTL